MYPLRLGATNLHLTDFLKWVLSVAKINYLVRDEDHIICGYKEILTDCCDRVCWV